MKTFYENLMKHVEQHAYTKGRFKGDAPADKNRRSRTWHRVTADTGRGYAAVVFHYTEIIRAYPEGVLMFDFGGHHLSPTTREAFNQASLQFTPGNTLRTYVGTQRKFNVSRVCLHVDKGWTPFYDNMRMNESDRSLITPPKPFRAKRINKDRSKELTAALKRSGFKDLFPIMYSAADDWVLDIGMYRAIGERYGHRHNSSPLHSLLIDDAHDEAQMDLWRRVIVANKFYTTHEYNWDTKVYGPKTNTRSAKETWSRIVSTVRSHFQEVVDTDTYYI